MSKAGEQKEGIQVIPQQARIKQVYLDLIRSASFEILLIFPTINAIRREEKIGIMDEVRLAVKRGIKIRILTPEDDFIRDNLEHLRTNNISVRNIETSAESKFKLLIVDKKTCFMVETKDDSKADFLEAVGLAVISNSRSTVQPYVSIFESFWRETELYEKAKEAERVKDEFVSIASHELRNPIMPILTNIEFLREDINALKIVDTDENNKIKESIESSVDTILRNSTRLLQLSEDVLQVSKIESGTFTLNIEPVNFNSLVESAISDVKKKYLRQKTNVQFVFEPKIEPDGKSVLYCDKSKITQGLFNIIDNATKFTEKGQIRVRTLFDDEHILVQIKDSGTGIDQSVSEKLFEKFASKSQKGIGLGLYITRKIIEVHGGKIWASNNADGEGATFSFTLPADLHPRTSKTTYATKEFPAYTKYQVLI